MEGGRHFVKPFFWASTKSWRSSLAITGLRFERPK
jgi:hypothetical protein